MQVELGDRQSPLSVKEAVLVMTMKELGWGYRRDSWGPEEQLISSYPELLAVGLLCPPLKENEAVVVEGVEGVNQTSRYESVFRTDDFDRLESPTKVVTMAATVELPRPSCQYDSRFLRRQISCIELAVRALPSHSTHVSSTNWRCVSDPVLEFCLTWIACSRQGIALTFTVDDPHLPRFL